MCINNNFCHFRENQVQKFQPFPYIEKGLQYEETDQNFELKDISKTTEKLVKIFTEHSF